VKFKRVLFTVLLAATAVICSSSRAAGPVVSGTVTDNPSGQPVNRAVVTLESLDGKTTFTMTTRPDGLFHFDVPLDGIWSLIVLEQDHLFAIHGPLTISSGRTLRQDIQLERPRILGEDRATCDRSLVTGRVEGLRKMPPAAV
jgi:hypothetical protein